MTQTQNKLSGLSSAKKAVLFDLLRKKRQAEGGTDRIEPREDRLAPLPLSFSQLRLWFLDRLHPGDPVYNLPSATRILGSLHLPSLALALAGVADRHEALRTTFAATEDGEPVQVIAPRFVPRLPVVDLGALPAARRNPEIRRMSALESRLPFDLEKGPLLRGCVFRCTDDEHLLLLEMHHIVSDGWSMGVLVNEIGALYPAFLAGQPSPLPELPIQYPDFAIWQRRRLSGALLEAELDWWRSRLAGMSPVLELPADHPRQAVRSTRGAGRTFLIDPAALSELQALSRRHETTLFMTLLAGFFILLQRYTGEDDLAVATPIAGRTRAELGSLIGFFINTLVLRTDLGGNPSFSDLLTRVRETTLSSYAHQELPFERLVEELAPERDLSRPPLVQVMFTMENAPEGTLEHPGIEIIPEGTGLGVSKFELTCTYREIEEGLFCMLDYGRELFEAPTMVRLGGHLERLLSGVLAEPQRPFAEIPLLAPGERHQLLAEWNDTEVDYPRGHRLHELVAAQAEKTPGAVAAVDENEQATYRELVDRARQLAGHLARLGVKPDGRVGVLLERSLAMVTGLLGVLEAGAAYVPLDPTLPEERLATLVENAGLSAVVTQDRFAALLPVDGPPAVRLDALHFPPLPVEGGAPSEDTEGGQGGEGLAYVLYTSGSTGTPKGVMIPHRGIVNRLQWMQEAYGLTAEDRVLQKTPFGFDVSVWEFFWPLLCGARLVLAQPEGHKDPRYLADLIAREKITTVHFVPSMLEVFLETPGLEALASLRRVVASGEALPPQLVRRFFSRLPHAELHNLYGPTEASVDVSFWPCVPEPPSDVVPIGRPIANHQLHGVDRTLAPQPVGVPGELLLGGPGLARGYLGRPDLTAAVFIPDPFGAAPGGRLYRTGDLVRRLADGTVHYLGRIDHQVKIRGFRIELGEIEAALARLPGVREAVVLVREDETGDKRLAAYVANTANTASSTDPAPAPEDLRTALRRTLPEAMVPAEVVVLPSLPLNANGKVDRRALAKIAPAAARPVARFLAPQGPVEEVLAQIWTEVLGGERRGLARIGAQDDFFTLGGHSLLATQVMSRVRNAFGVELPLRAFFEAPTVTALAARIDGERRGEHAQPSPILPVPRDRDLPLSFAQQRLWFLDRLAPDNPFYNMFGAVRLTGALDLDALRGAFREIVRRQEALRTTFRPGERGPVQVIAPPPALEVPLVDLEGLAEDPRRRELARLSGDEARRPFNLAKGPLVRAALLRIAAQEHTLLVNLHHIISDGWSMGIVFHELATLYGAFCQGAPSPLPELPIQYADFAVWQREWLSGERLAAELDHWRRQLAGIPESLELPFDHPRPAVESFRGATESFALPAELARALSALTRRRGATQSMTLLAGFTALLGRFAGCEDVAVGMAIANRTRREVEGLIGFFVNTLVLRTDLSGTPGFAQLVGRVRETSLASYAHQDLPFERLVEELQPERSLSRNPLIQVMCGYQNFPRAEAEVRGLTLSLPEEGKVAGGTAKFDLSLFLFEDGDRLTGALEYNSEIFEAASMLRLLRCFENLLAAAVADPEAPVAFLPLLGAAERHQLACEWNDSASDWPSTSSFQELFLEHVRRAPETPAVIAGTASLSYADLNRRADGLARALRHRGAGPGRFVGLCVERSAQAVVALVAILKTGAAYVPLDPDYPAERLAVMMDDCDLNLLVVDETTRALLPQGLLSGRETLTPDPENGTGEGPKARAALAQGNALGGEALAHVIYTSGSTGRPKGVALSHRAVVRLVRETNYVHLEPGDRVAQVSNISFDAATYEIWGALLNGATLVVIPRDVVLSPPGLAAALSEHRITNMILTSALFARMGQEEPDAFAGMRELLVGGEVVDPAAARRVLAGRAPGQLLNLYGPTENTTYSTWYPVRTVAPGPLPIGSPVANTTVYVLDRWLQPVPLGVVGELAIGGQGLAWGYWRRPELTAERFVPDFAGPAGSRLYRTGDLGRRRADGILEILGRIDHQVKIRGFRIELGEIEARLAEHPAVRQAVVLAREEVPGDKRLAAYVVQNPAYESAESGEQTEQVSQWGEIFDDLYREESAEADPTFNIIGWNSTYTGLPLPASEMEEWLDDTIRGITELEPRRTLEIGCGTGMILFRIAPRCELYTGIDVSGRALRYIESELGRVGLGDGRVRLLRKSAHELDGFAADSFDTVVVNSVAQYFPSADYLAEVVARAVELVRPGGAIFLGDLRSLPLLEAFHTALELFQADPATPLSRLRQKVHARHMDENELAIDPAFFTALRERLPKLGRIEIHLKHGRAHNELTGFRYQAVLRVGPGQEEPVQDGALNWRRERLTLAALRRRLAEEAPPVVRLRNIPNARVAEDTAAVRLLQEAPEGIETAEDLRRRAAEAALGAVEPQDLWDLAKDFPYQVELSWAEPGADGSFEAVLWSSLVSPLPAGWEGAGRGAGGEAPSLAAYTNNPLQGRFARRIVPELRAFLEARLPAYMMPSAFVLLDALPITPNGKVDRRRLPAPGGLPESGRSLVAARNATEERLLSIWKELLGVDRIGVEDDFFALGGHSLLATQAVSRVRQAFGVELPLRTFFEAPSVASVAAEISRLRLGGGEADVPPIVPVPRDGRLPLSFAQERLWFLDRLEARTLAYNEAAAFRLEGPLDIAAFRGALDEILLRHESLRTAFPEVDGEAVQVIRPTFPFDPFEIPVVDLQALRRDLHGEEVYRLALSQALRPFSLAHGPLVRGLLMRLGENDHAVLFSFHHIIFDGWSVGVFVRELSALYRARVAGVPASLPPLAVQYADFAAWQRGWLQGEVLERQVAWWRGQLTGAAVLELPTDRPRPILAQAPSGLLHPVLRPSLTEPLRAFSRDHGATLFMTLLAGFQALLHRHTGQTDISVGTPIANRNHGDVEKLIGFFINMLVLRTDLSGDPGFGDLVDRVRQTALGAYDHQSVPFAKLVEELRPERDLRHTPLFQVSFQVLNIPQSPLELPGITLHPLSFAARSAKFDLDLALADAADRLAGVLDGVLDYNADLFDATTMERFLAHLEQLLLGAMDDPARRLSELPLLTAAERSQLAIEWNDTASASADPPCLHHLIAQRIAEAPEAPAAVCGDRRLTFGDLGRQSASLALRLREHGVGPEVPVVLFLDRSVEAIAGFVGILEAGGVYVPVDPTYPAERIAWILEDCKAPVVVTTSVLASRLPNGTPAVLLDELGGGAPLPEAGGAMGEGPGVRSLADHPAYIIYTSGSTGRPKGVVVRHGAVVNLARALRETVYREEAGPLRVGVNASFSFDGSIKQLVQLAWGHSLHILPQEVRLDPVALVDTVRRQRIDVLDCTPSQLRPLLAAGLGDGGEDAAPALVLVGGEAVDADLRGAALSRSHQGRTRFWNVYGPTECTVDTAVALFTAGAAPSRIGRPLPNVRVHTVTASGTLAALGVPGELRIGGAGLARGYLGRPDLTAERFIPNPFSGDSGARLYRTGDLVRQLPDGSLDFLGRLDNQVKVRGYRIELGEIEAALGALPSVREAVVIAKSDRLIAYVTGEALDTAALRHALRDKLPDFMLPSAIVALPALPLTPSGKVDRKALPEPDSGPAPGFVAPRTAVEEVLAEIWAELLGIAQIGVHDNFFERGGHSLLAVLLMARIEKRLGTTLPLAALFSAPTLEALAALAETSGGHPAGGKGRGSLVAIKPATNRDTDQAPFFCVHPIGGNVLCYLDLARHLAPDQPFYALQTPDDRPPAKSIEEMAARYLAEVRRVQPQGPYRLGGWSMGGLVAFAMARQLAAEGQAPELLALIDTLPPETATAPATDEELVASFAQDMARLLGFNVGISPEELRSLPEQEKLAHVVRLGHTAGLLPADFGLAQIEPLFATFAANLQASRAYAPEPYAGRLTLWVSEATAASYAAALDAWSRLVPAGLDRAILPGDHYSLLRRPEVERLARELTAQLVRNNDDGSTFAARQAGRRIAGSEESAITQGTAMNTSGS